MSGGPIDDGGSAFPCPVEFDPNQQLVSHGSFGMSLRDWFAGQASEQDIDQHRDYRLCPKTSIVISCRTRERARYAYADAMIAQRKGGEG